MSVNRTQTVTLEKGGRRKTVNAGSAREAELVADGWKREGGDGAPEAQPAPEDSGSGSKPAGAPSRGSGTRRKRATRRAKPKG